MSNAKSPSDKSTWVALILGLVILGLLVAFAVGLPKATGATGSLALPDTLPGGYTASDLPQAFENGQYAERAKQIAGQEAHTRAYADKVLADVLPEDAVTRTYVTKDLAAVYVQAFRSEGGAFAPNSMSDPGTTGQQHAPLELVPVGDAVCIESWGQATTGQSPAPQYVQCQRSNAGLTVQVSSAGVAPDELADLSDSVLAALQDQ